MIFIKIAFSFVDFAATNSELKEAVSSVVSHTMTGTDLNIPDNTDTQNLCGAVYLIVVLKDMKNLRNPTRDKRTG